MKDSSSGQIKIGLILSYINISIGNIIPLIYTPIMLSILGQSEYGLYKISVSTTSYLSLMAFGIGSAITRYLIKAETEGGKIAEENTFGLFHLIFQLIAVVTLIVGFILVFNLNLFYDASLTNHQLDTMRILVGIMVVNTAISFSASSYNAVVTARERFVFLHTVNIIVTIGGPVLSLIVLKLGYMSVGMATASLFMNIVLRVTFILFVRYKLQLKPRYNAIPLNIVKEVIVFSFWIFLASIVSQMYAATDMIIIGSIPQLATLGAAVYSIGNTFPKIMFSMAQVTPSLFMPRANKMVFQGSSDYEISELVIKVGRMQCYIVALICSGFIVFGREFISWYVGDIYYEAYWVAVIIMVPSCIPLVQSAANSILQAKNKHKFRALVYLIIATINIVFTLLLVNKYGVIGAAIPTAVAYIIGNGLIMNWYYYKVIKLNIPKFWRQVFPIFTLAIILAFFSFAILRFVDLGSLMVLFLAILLFTVVYFTLCFIYIMNDEEKMILRTITKSLYFRILYKEKK